MYSSDRSVEIWFGFDFVVFYMFTNFTFIISELDFVLGCVYVSCVSVLIQYERKPICKYIEMENNSLNFVLKIIKKTINKKAIIRKI